MIIWWIVIFTILPIGIILSYEGYHYYKNRNIRNLKKLLNKEEREQIDSFREKVIENYKVD